MFSLSLVLHSSISQFLNFSIQETEQPSGGREGCSLTGFGRSKVDLKKGGKSGGQASVPSWAAADGGRPGSPEP